MNYTLIQAVGGDPEIYGYTVQGGGQVRREYGSTPNGNPMSGRWVYRDETGKLADFNQFRNDLFERNNLRETP